MAIKMRRIEPGFYVATVNDEEYRVYQIGGRWIATTGHPGSKPKVEGKTKKAVVSALETHGRLTKDRVTTKELKIPRRSVIEKGTELSLIPGSVQGLSGRVNFVCYTKTSSGKEWAEVTDSKGRSRLIDPAKIKTVHRKRKY